MRPSLAILRQCDRIPLGRTAATVRVPRKALSAEFNSELYAGADRGAALDERPYSDGGSQLNVGGMFTPSNRTWE